MLTIEAATQPSFDEGCGGGPSMPTARPKVKVPRTATEKAVELVALVGAVALVVVAGSGWRAADGLVPTHFGADGRADAWGERVNLLLLPAVVLPMYVALTVLSRFPHVYNYSVPITEQNAAAQYQNARSLVVWLNAQMVWLFVYIEWHAIPAEDAGAPSLGIAFLPVSLLAVLLTIAIHVGRMIRLR